MPVTQLAGSITSVDPNHSLEAVNEQVFGVSVGQPDPAPMNGFVSSYIKNVGGDVAKGKAIMDCHAPESIPVLSGLAKNYRVCTRWFSSVPGQTWPNRFYMHAATSRGLVSNDPLDEDALTIFDKLDAAKRSWRIYAGDVPQSLSIERLAGRFLLEHLKAPQDRHFRSLGQYFNDLQQGTLPNYSFIEPQYFNTPLGQATDQHPPHDILLGEALLGHVYNSLLSSTYWQDSLLLVLFDEHGGFFDSVPPPRGVPAPDEFVASQPVFDFTRLGPRVPAVLVSPWVEPGVDATVYDHTSISATLNALFELGTGGLSEQARCGGQPVQPRPVAVRAAWPAGRLSGRHDQRAAAGRPGAARRRRVREHPGATDSPGRESHRRPLHVLLSPAPPARALEQPDAQPDVPPASLPLAPFLGACFLPCLRTISEIGRDRAQRCGLRSLGRNDAGAGSMRKTDAGGGCVGLSSCGTRPGE